MIILKLFIFYVFGAGIIASIINNIIFKGSNFEWGDEIGTILGVIFWPFYLIFLLGKMIAYFIINVLININIIK